jgi:hypothetical protein
LDLSRDAAIRGPPGGFHLLPRSSVNPMIAAMSQPSQRERRSRSHRAKHGATVLLLLVTGLFATSPARAANREAKERMARTACLAGDYAKGVTILSELFVLTNDPTYIYNQARCFQQNSKFQEAISRFQEHLRVGKKLSAEDKAETQKQISDCQAQLAAQSGQTVTAAPAVQAAPPVAPPTATQTPTVAPAPVIVEQAVPSNSSPVPGSGLRTAGVITAVVGGVALVAGVILNVKVNSMASGFQNLNGYTDSKESERKSLETLGWVSYGVGAACVATGSVLYILGLQGRKQGSTLMAFVPAFGPGGAAAILKGAF